jgi:kynureninase
MEYQIDKDFAIKKDNLDPLKEFRNEFIFPQHDGEDSIYFTGNSLGLQPRKAKKIILEELEDWGTYGVEGHTQSRRPWVKYHEFFTKSLAELTGSLSSEVVAMNGLTSNLHFLMVSFYRPTEKRYKILCEAKAFPSDQYALASQVRFHGYEPAEAIIEVGPRKGEHTVREEDFLEIIEKHGDEIAMMMIGGVNYYSGQVYDMRSLTAAARNRGIIVGWDLAHGAGNIALQLHDWGVDFAAWCSYKYLNAGPGATSAVFIHERHHGIKDIPRLEGWWGTNKARRFLMEPEFDPIPTAEAWQLSNAPVLSMAPLLASLDLFERAGMERLLEKQKDLTGYLEYVIEEIAREDDSHFEIITPTDKTKRGAQLSVLLHGKGKEVFEYLQENGVIADWREPNVIRMAPVPMYNSYSDVYRFAEIFRKAINT